MDSWLAQARRGVIELCVLALIAGKPRYGYELAVELSRWPPLATTEGTLYPLLRRLQREQLVDAFWEESQDGPPRKYYRLSEAGRTLLDAQLADWQRLTEAIANLSHHANEDKEVPNGSGPQRQSTLPRRTERKPEPTTRR